jgi:hypothetical protein
VNQLDPPIAEQKAPRDKERVRTVVEKGCECRIDLAAAAGFEHSESQSCSRRGAVQLSQDRLGHRGCGINENSNLYGPRHKRTQQFQPLRCDLSNQIIDPCNVPAWPCEARDQTKPDRVFTDGEHR